MFGMGWAEIGVILLIFLTTLAATIAVSLPTSACGS